MRVAALAAAGFFAAAGRLFGDLAAVERFTAGLLLAAAFDLAAPLRGFADLEADAALVAFFAAGFAAVAFLAAPVRALADLAAGLLVDGFCAADFFAVLRVVVLVAISVGSFIETNWVHGVCAPSRWHPIRDVCEHIHLPLVSNRNLSPDGVDSFNTARLIVPSVGSVNWKFFNINLLATSWIA